MSIEHLFYISLCTTMPQHIWNLSYIMPQKTVCNNKYHIDFALCDRKTGKVQIGIECDGFHIHYNTPKKVENNNMRDREIKRLEGFDILSRPLVILFAFLETFYLFFI
mgnify:CR=1 FL=1